MKTILKTIFLLICSVPTFLIAKEDSLPIEIRAAQHVWKGLSPERKVQIIENCWAGKGYLTKNKNLCLVAMQPSLQK